LKGRVALFNCVAKEALTMGVNFVRINGSTICQHIVEKGDQKVKVSRGVQRFPIYPIPIRSPDLEILKKENTFRVEPIFKGVKGVLSSYWF
jgi:hypothetical protein